MTFKNAAIAAAALGAAAWLAAPAVAGETKGPVTDDFGVVKINVNDPVIIGAYLAIGGPESALGIDEKRAIEIAFDEVDWKIAGHPIIGAYLADGRGFRLQTRRVARTRPPSSPPTRRS